MGLLDGDNAPLTLGLLGGLGAMADSFEPSRLPRSPIAGLLRGAAGFGQGYLSGTTLGPQLAYLKSHAEAADLANRLNRVNVNYYENANQPTRNPAAGLLGGGAAPASATPAIAPVPPIADAFNAGVSLPAYNAQPASDGTGPGAAPSVGSGFMLDPATMIARAQAAMKVPALAPQAAQYLKMAESALNSGLGVRGNGTIDTLPGYLPSVGNIELTKSTAKTLGENNKDQVVGPGAAYIPGPRTFQEYAASLQPGQQTRPSYVNPNPTQQNIINMPAAHTFFDKVGTGLGENATEVLNAGDKAATQLLTTQAMRDLVQAWREAGGSQGASAPFQAKMTALVQGLGLNPEALGLPKDAGPAQALEALSKKMALGQIGAGGLPANNFSEADRRFVTEMQGAISDTPSGFEAKILMAERLAQRSQEAQQSLSQAIFGGPPETAPQRYAEWRARQNANSAMRPLFTPEDKARIKALVEQSKAEQKARPASAAPPIDPDAARQELIRRGVIAQ